jgi:predicted nuclease of restriction endonuclease-like (RecB) superfamily
MTKKRTTHRRSQVRASSSAAGYAAVLAELKDRISTARHLALATVNQELVALYWDIGRIIVRQQEEAAWGDAVVEQLSADLRAAFPDMKGLTRENLFRTRKFWLSCREIDAWLATKSVARDNRQLGTPESRTRSKKVATVSPQSCPAAASEKVATVSPQIATLDPPAEIVATLWRQFRSPQFANLIASLSWSHHKELVGAVDRPAERYFYMAMSVRDRWSVRELRRQIDSDLFTRYVSVKSHPEKCLPEVAEQGDLLPFKDHYVLEFLALTEEHSEQELRKSILTNLRDFFLEFGKDLTFVGEEFPLTVGGDTFHIDLLFFHRRLRCLISVDLKKGKFKPEYAGKSRFYCAALDELIKLPDENPSLGLVLCRSADAVQVRLALTDAAQKIGVATYQTALPDEKRLQQRLMQLPMPADAGGEGS